MNFQLEKRNVTASQTLRSALIKTENTHPGFAYNLVAGIMKQGDISINMNESVLRLQGTVSDLEGMILLFFDIINYRLKIFIGYHTMLVFINYL